MAAITVDDVRAIGAGFQADPSVSKSLHSQAYTEAKWLEADLRGILARSWQWICHVEKLAEPGSYIATRVAGMPIAVVRDRVGRLRGLFLFLIVSA